MIELDGYSLVAIYSAMAIYTIAFVLFAVDMAQRSSRKAPPRPEKTPGQVAQFRGAVTVLQQKSPPAEAPTVATRIGQAAFALVVLGWLLHVGGVVLRTLAQGFVPWASMFEFSLTSSAISVGVFIVIQRWLDVKFLGVYLVGFTLLSLGVGTVNFYVPVKPLPPALDSYWLVIHVFVASLATAFFTLGAGLAIGQLVQSAREAGKRSFSWFTSLPDSTRLETMSYMLNVIGFVFWSFTLIAGAIWAERSWGRYWGWDNKEVWTFIVWVVYAGYVHARATRGWRGTRSSWLALVGFATVIFNYTAVNLFLPGLHAYSGI